MTRQLAHKGQAVSGGSRRDRESASPGDQHEEKKRTKTKGEFLYSLGDVLYLQRFVSYTYDVLRVMLKYCALLEYTDERINRTRNGCVQKCVKGKRVRERKK